MNPVQHIGGTGMALMVVMYFTLLYLCDRGFPVDAPIVRFVLVAFGVGASVAVVAFIMGLWP